MTHRLIRPGLRYRFAVGGLPVAAALVGAGCGDDGNGQPFGSNIINRVEVATRGGDFRESIDATPSPDGSTVYFTGSGPGGGSIFRVAAAGTDQVLVIDLRTLRSGVLDQTIGANRRGGGLHRAHNVNVFAWADSTASALRPSRVYVLQL